MALNTFASSHEHRPRDPITLLRVVAKLPEIVLGVSLWYLCQGDTASGPHQELGPHSVRAGLETEQPEHV